MEELVVSSEVLLAEILSQFVLVNRVGVSLESFVSASFGLVPLDA